MKKKTAIASKPPSACVSAFTAARSTRCISAICSPRDALEQLRLDAVLFVLCGQSPLKSRKPRATDARRLAMLRLALKNHPRFWLTRCELDRPAPPIPTTPRSKSARPFRARNFSG